MIDREKKVEIGRKTIDYLHGFVDKNDEIAKALNLTGLEGLPPNKFDCSSILTEIMNTPMDASNIENHNRISEEKIQQASKESIQYSLDLARIYLHLFSSPDIYIQRALRLPEGSGKYKFIIFADQTDYPELKDIPCDINKPKKILPDITLEASELEYHKDISNKNELDDTIFVYGGGRIEINKENKTIKLYGESGSYGKVSNNLVHRLVQELKDDGYDVTVEMGVGY